MEADDCGGRDGIFTWLLYQKPGLGSSPVLRGHANDHILPTILCYHRSMSHPDPDEPQRLGLEESDVTASILRERLRFFFLQSPLGIVLSPMGAGLLSAGLWDAVDHTRLLMWVALIALLSVARLVLWIGSPRQTQSLEQLRVCERRLGASIVVVALAWGLGGVFLMPGTMSGKLLIFCCLMTMAGGTNALYSVHPLPTALALAALTLPLAAAFAFQHDSLFLVLSLAIVLYLVGSFRGIKMLDHFLVRSHQLAHELEVNYRALQRSEAMREDLTHMLVHDLRTPLTAIIGHAQLAKISPDPKLDMAKVSELSRSLVQMVGAILDVNRLENDQMPMSPRSLEIGPLVGLAISDLGLPGQKVVFEGDSSLQVHCDPDLIRRVLTNLLSNALRYSPPGESVRVSLSPQTGSTPAPWVEVRVCDRGPGVPPEAQARIFDKYTQSGKRHGNTSGLGLTFCKLVVDKHGGTIGLDSQPGQGAQFWFRLPTPGK